MTSPDRKNIIDDVDRRRPESEWFLDNYMKKLLLGHAPNTQAVPHSDLFYIRAALEEKFPDRLFTIQEIKNILKEELGVDIN
jgi:hypothetical protein